MSTSEIFMFCDKCQRTFSKVFSNCTQCGGPLRDFEVPGYYKEPPKKVEYKLGLRDLARYPFLPEAGEYIAKKGYDLSLFDSEETSWVVGKAGQRVIDAMTSNVNKAELDSGDQDILTFLAAALIVRTIGKPKVTNHFALGEARRIEHFLERDVLKGNDIILFRIFRDFTKREIEYNRDLNLYSMPVAVYMMMSESIKDPHWTLINRDVVGGKVYLETEDTIRLIRESISQIIKSRLLSMKIKDVPESVKRLAEEFRAAFKDSIEYVNLSKQSVSGYPPCILHVVGMLNRGENVPHAGRFFLATYMIGIGKSIDEVVDLFRNAPDFSEKITKTQVEHIAGEKGSRTKYSCPGCEKLKNGNLCYETEACKGISNPMQFGRSR